MNAHLSERLGRGDSFRDPEASFASAPTRVLISNLSISIRKYIMAEDSRGGTLDWTGLPEFPAPHEVFLENREKHEEDVEIYENIIVGPYPSKDDYLSRHYGLLREDAVSPLRDVVSEIQLKPKIMEAASENDAFIYEKVYITGYTFAQTGLAARVTFSLGRVGRKVPWEQSKRLRTGTLVCLTPANAVFSTVARIAVVAARPLAGLEENPPSVDLFFGSPELIEIDPQQEWLMVESRNGFYEGHRHVLKGLQTLQSEPFPLSEYIVDLRREIEPPVYISNNPILDCSTLFPNDATHAGSINITHELPDLPCEVDQSQLEALQRILGKRLSIVQGPPGTGKTHVSVIALRLMLRNMKPGDPPILVSAHTNHAIDQLLRHVAKFEPNFIRLGGMSTDLEIIKPRTLYEIKQSIKCKNPPGSLRGSATKQLKKLANDIKAILKPLTLGNALLDPSLLQRYDVISSEQHQSLISGASDWFSGMFFPDLSLPLYPRIKTFWSQMLFPYYSRVCKRCSDSAFYIGDTDIEGEMAIWLGDEKVKANLRISPEDFGIEFEEVDLEFEQIREIEAENKILDDDDDFETLRGERINFSEKWTGRRLLGVIDPVKDPIIKAEAKKRDMYEIPDEYRGPVYKLLQHKVKEAICNEVREKAKQYAKASRDAKIGRFELDYNYLKDARIVGLTTSGLAKYRSLLHSIEPKVVLIEEAAETLESYVSVSCFASLGMSTPIWSQACRIVDRALLNLINRASHFSW